MKIAEKLREIEENNDLILNESYFEFLKSLKEKIKSFENEILNYKAEKIENEREYNDARIKYSECSEMNEFFKHIGRKSHNKGISVMNQALREYENQFKLSSILENYKGKNIEICLDNIKSMKDEKEVNYSCKEELKSELESLLKSISGKAVPNIIDKGKFYEFNLWVDNTNNIDSIRNLFRNYETMLFSKKDEYMKFALKLEKNIEKEV